MLYFTISLPLCSTETDDGVPVAKKELKQKAKKGKGKSKASDNAGIDVSVAEGKATGEGEEYVMCFFFVATALSYLLS